MSKVTAHDYLYNKSPLSGDTNRDENILIDVIGNWIPECDIIYYGLLGSKYSDILYKLKTRTMFNPHDIYLETCYFGTYDLIKYLASDNELPISDEETSQDFINDAATTAFSRYSYVPCNETMFRHSIIELAYFDFVKSITLLYPWDIRPIDYEYLQSIIPKTVWDKFNIASGSMLNLIKDNASKGFSYSTIVLNSLSDINFLIDNCEEYKTDSTFFLLRNYSENVKYEIIDDSENENNRKISFSEIGSYEILNKLMDMEQGIPKTKMRFARYEPLLFDDAKPKAEDFPSNV